MVKAGTKSLLSRSLIPLVASGENDLLGLTPQAVSEVVGWSPSGRARSSGVGRSGRGEVVARWGVARGTRGQSGWMVVVVDRVAGR